MGAGRSGKSTLAVALAQEGFGFLSDDRTFCSWKKDKLSAWGLATTLKLRSDAGKHFRELQAKQPKYLPNGERGFRLDVIVSLDGPPALHDQIRRVPHAFEQIKTGVAALRSFRPEIIVRARCTVQKANHGSLCEVVKSAKEIGLNSISFLAADLTSEAFNRPQGWAPERQDRVALNADEADALEAEVERLVIERRLDLKSGFVVESAGKLRRIVLHFHAHLGQAPHVAPSCNAPWVSSVIEASGEVRPCIFHPSFGNIHDQPLRQIVNSPKALSFRAALDVATNPVCRRCVCSLHIPRHEE